MNASLFVELLARQQVLILIREGASFRPAGLCPGWFASLLPEGTDTAGALEPGRISPFIEHFLPDAERCWKTGGDTELRSGIWTETARDDTDIPLEATACTIDGQGVLLIRRVETEFVQLHRALQRGRELSITHEKLVSETGKKEILLHCIIHDLSGPLSGITAAFDILRKETLGRDARKFLELGRIGTRQQANLIGDLLDSFRSEMGSSDAAESDPASAPDAIECAREVIDSLKPAFAVRGVHVKLTFAAGVADHSRVAGEHHRLQRVMHNLLQNALRHSKARGSVIVNIHRDGPHTIVAVEDEGPGIPAEIAPQLFQKFVRGRGTSGKAGLGLFFCRITVEQWGGSIGCEPRAEGGTRFWFRLKTV